MAYQGAESSELELCRILFDGRPASGWFGIWLTVWAGAEQAWPVLCRLIQGRAGDTEGFESLPLLGTTYCTVKVSHYRECLPPNTYRSVATGWNDLDTGTLVYVTYQHISGVPEAGAPLDPTLIVTAP